MEELMARNNNENKFELKRKEELREELRKAEEKLEKLLGSPSKDGYAIRMAIVKVNNYRSTLGIRPLV